MVVEQNSKAAEDIAVDKTVVVAGMGKAGKVEHV